MACPLWGDGSLWGDGDTWCREFGSNPYITEVDQKLRRCSVSVTYSGSVLFMIDDIRPNIDWGVSQQSHTYEAWLDVHNVARVSTQIAFSDAVSFQVFYITPDVNIKKHQPVG